MGLAVCGGTELQCSFGTATSMLNVFPENRAISRMSLANIMDNKPFVNIMPFAMCRSMNNPMVAEATAAAFGVLTPMPCVPAIQSPWMPACPTVFIGGIAALSDSSTCVCSWSGLISIKSAGQTSIEIP